MSGRSYQGRRLSATDITGAFVGRPTRSEIPHGKPKIIPTGDKLRAVLPALALCPVTHEIQHLGIRTIVRGKQCDGILFESELIDVLPNKIHEIDIRARIAVCRGIDNKNN
jgi:hypothetical protein